MERQIERRREAEPTMHDYNWNEGRYLRYVEEKKRLASQPHVIKFDSVPWVQVQQAYHKVLVGGNKLEERLLKGPIYTMTCLEQIIKPGGRSGRHRHFQEALFFIMEGKGWEVHDEVKYPWEAGDLMCVPTYCIHQHFADPTNGARLFYIISPVFTYMGLGNVEQMELHEGFRVPADADPIHGTEGDLIGYKKTDGTEIRLILEEREVKEMMAAKERAAKLSGQPRDGYEDYIAALAEESQWRKTCPHVVKASQRPWENTRMGKIKYLAHPRVPSGLLIFTAWLQEIPPGGHSGKHRHVGEEVHLIMEGKGYDVHDNTRWDWEKDDVVCIPVNTVHQHFNSDARKPALFLAVQPRIYDFVGHKGVEHWEDASGYKR